MNNVLRSPLPVHGSVPCVSACDTRANGVGWAEAGVHQHWVRRSNFQHTTREGTHLSEDDAAASSPADTLYDGMDAYLHVAPAVGESIIALVCPADGGGTALAPECDAVVKLPGCRSIKSYQKCQSTRREFQQLMGTSSRGAYPGTQAKPPSVSGSTGLRLNATTDRPGVRRTGEATIRVSDDIFVAQTAERLALPPSAPGTSRAA